jgi:hypothetical protein
MIGRCSMQDLDEIGQGASGESSRAQVALGQNDRDGGHLGMVGRVHLGKLGGSELAIPFRVSKWYVQSYLPGPITKHHSWLQPSPFVTAG